MVQPPAAKQTLQVPDGVSGNLYTYNSLNPFSFGSTQPQQASSSRPVHPLHRIKEMRTVLVMNFVLDHQTLLLSHLSSPTHKSINSPMILFNSGNKPRSPGVYDCQIGAGTEGVMIVAVPRETQIDTSRTRTSPASASVTSLSGTGVNYSRPGSRASHTSSSTSQMSVEQSSITNSDDGDDHRHPFAPHATNTVSRGPTSIGTGSASNMAVEFSSDEEFVDSEYDYNYYDKEGVNIEIGSAQYEGSIVTHDWDCDFLVGSGNSSGSIRSGLVYSERRGSNLIAIPRTPPVDDSVFTGSRNREDSGYPS